ncbi:MAG: HipA domain-containing protein [Bdellovibrionota bacterium]
MDKQDGHYGLHPACFGKWFKSEDRAEFLGLVRRATSNNPPGAPDAGAWNTSFFQGNFKKYSAQLAGESYIFKVREDHVPELPDVEYTCNRIGRLLKIPVPEFYLIEFSDNRTFVTKNFVKSSGTTTLNHIYHYLKDGEHNVENVMAIIEEQTNKPYYLDVFVKTCLYDSIIGNHDRHGRNLGFITSAKSTVLSPIYDNTSALGLESGSMLQADFEPKGKIFTRDSQEPTTKDYVREFLRLGHRDSVDEFASITRADKLLQIVNEGFATPLMKDALSRLIQKRCKELHDEFSKSNQSA